MSVRPPIRGGQGRDEVELEAYALATLAAFPALVGLCVVLAVLARAIGGGR